MWELGLLPSGDETWAIRLSSKALHLVSHLAGRTASDHLAGQFLSFPHIGYFLSAKCFAFLSHRISMTTHFPDEAKAYGEEIIV